MMGLVRYVLFCLFFAIGAGTVGLSILADEVRDYYESKSLLAKTLADNEKIQSLTADYESQIQQIQNDPNTILRLKLVTLGEEPTAKDTVYPKASEEQLAAAGRALLEDSQSPKTGSDIPEWVQRCSEPDLRQSLFFAGAGLVLIAFICFGSPAKPKRPGQHCQTGETRQ
jgi:hypothetical protein